MLNVNELKTWEHAIKCNQIKEMKRLFTVNLLKELLGNKEDAIHFEEIFEMIKDALRCLKNEKDEEYKTNRGQVGMQYLF